MVAAGADGVKVGVGRGSICTTRVVAGRRRAADHRDPRLCGGGQAARDHPHRRRWHPAVGRHPEGAGGRSRRGDARITARRRRRVAGRGRAPPGRAVQGVPRHGVAGRHEGRSYSKDRYFQGDVVDADKLVPEGIEGRVAYKGPLANVLFQLVGGLRQAMGYCGTGTHRGAQGARPVHPHHRRRAPREPPARHHDHQGSAELLVAEPAARRHVVLLGLMGAGKTSVGRRVATRLERPLLDGDEVLEDRTGGLTAADVVDREGAERLHALEAEIALDMLRSGTPAVIGPAASVIEVDGRARLAGRPLRGVAHRCGGSARGRCRRASPIVRSSATAIRSS